MEVNIYVYVEINSLHKKDRAMQVHEIEVQDCFTRIGLLTIVLQYIDQKKIRQRKGTSFLI